MGVAKTSSLTLSTLSHQIQGEEQHVYFHKLEVLESETHEMPQITLCGFYIPSLNANSLSGT